MKLLLTTLAGGMLLTGLAATHTVSQKGRAFSSETLTVKAGDVVTFENDDDVAHNVFSLTDGHSFNLGVQAPGASDDRVFEEAGEVEIRCAFHPNMKMVVKVEN